MDRYNWTVERWIMPGERPNGTVSAGRWVNSGYFPKLEQAAQDMLDQLLLDDPERETVEELIEAVREARERVLGAVPVAAAA